MKLTHNQAASWMLRNKGTLFLVYEEFPLSSKRFRKILKQLMENLNDLIPSGGCPEVLWAIVNYVSCHMSQGVKQGFGHYCNQGQGGNPL